MCYELVGQQVDDPLGHLRAQATGDRLRDVFQPVFVQADDRHLRKAGFQALGHVTYFVVDCCADGNLARNGLVGPPQKQIDAALSVQNLLLYHPPKAELFRSTLDPLLDGLVLGSAPP